MDFFSNVVNIAFVAAIITIIQTIKGILKKKGKVINNDTWKMVVIILGIPMAFIMSFIEGWVGETVMEMVANFFVKSFIYSAAATLIYQTGKLSLSTFTDKKNG